MLVKKLTKRQRKRKQKYADINAERRLAKENRIMILKISNPESLEYRQAFWGEHGRVFVSSEDWKDIRAGEVAMHKTARTTIDQSKVPWHVHGRSQHRPFYHNQILVTNQLTD